MKLPLRKMGTRRDKVERPSDGESDKAAIGPPDIRQASDSGTKGMRGRTGNEGDRRV